MAPSPLNILVTGATGTIGPELVHLLSANPAVGEVRAASRDPEGRDAQLLAAFNPDIIKPIGFDDRDDGSLQTAFEGVDVLCLVTPLIEDMGGWQERVLAHAGGVRRILKVSVDAANPDAERGTIGGDHWFGEQLVAASAGEYGIVRPTLFMQHFMLVPGLYSAGDSAFYLPIADAGIAMLDARDIAAAVARMSTCGAGELPREPWMLTGPEALTGEELRDHLSLATGREFSWEADPSAFQRHSKEVGAPELVGAIYQAGADGAFAQTETSVFTDLVGRRPNSFAKFAFDNADHFRSRS